ncbi:protein of unknown function [Nitratireductor aquimarinus]
MIASPRLVAVADQITALLRPAILIGEVLVEGLGHERLAVGLLRFGGLAYPVAPGIGEFLLEGSIQLDHLGLAGAKRLHRLHVLIIEMDQRLHRGQLGCCFDLCLEGIVECVPGLLLDDHFPQEGRLMHARHDDIRRGLMEPFRQIARGRAPLNGVDALALQKRVDFTRRHDGRNRTEIIAHHLGPGAGCAVFQALEVCSAFDRLVGVRHDLGRTNTDDKRLQAFFGAQFGKLLTATAFEDPGGIGFGTHAARKTCEDRIHRVLVDEVARRGVAGLDNAVLHTVIDLQRRDENARAKRLDLDSAIRQAVDIVGKALKEIHIEGRAFGHRGRHAPGHFLRLCGRGGQRYCSGKGQTFEIKKHINSSFDVLGGIQPKPAMDALKIYTNSILHVDKKNN